MANRYHRIKFSDFHCNSTAIFRYCEAPTWEPDFVSGNSKYWHDHENDRVIRQANHWGKGIRKCDWYLIDMMPARCTGLPDGKMVTAYCNLGDFVPCKKNILRSIMNKVIDNRECDELWLATKQLAA